MLNDDIVLHIILDREYWWKLYIYYVFLNPTLIEIKEIKIKLNEYSRKIELRVHGSCTIYKSTHNVAIIIKYLVQWTKCDTQHLY